MCSAPSQMSDAATEKGLRRRFVKASLVVGCKSAEVFESTEMRDRGDGGPLSLGSSQLRSCKLQPDRPEMRHRRRVSKSAKSHLQRSRADPCHPRQLLQFNVVSP